MLCACQAFVAALAATRLIDEPTAFAPLRAGTTRSSTWLTLTQYLLTDLAGPGSS